MKNIIYKGNSREPSVNFDAEAGILEITGRSIPEGIGYTFFKPLLTWVNEYIENPAESTSIRFKLEYCNTTSFEIIFREMLRQLDELAGNGHDVKMLWQYDEEDEDMRDSGNDLASLLKNIKVEFSAVSEDEF